MSSSTPSLHPSALDRTRSLRKPTVTARLMKDSTTTGAVGTSTGSSTTATSRATGIGAPKQRPVSMMKMPSSTKGTLSTPGAVSRTVGSGSMGTAIGGGGIKRMASVSGTGSGTNSNIKLPTSGGLNRLAGTRLKREGAKAEDSGIETGAKVGSASRFSCSPGISKQCGHESHTFVSANHGITINIRVVRDDSSNYFVKLRLDGHYHKPKNNSYVGFWYQDSNAEAGTKNHRSFRHFSHTEKLFRDRKRGYRTGATPKAPTMIGGTPKPTIGAGLRSSPAHKRTGSAASVSTTGTATTTGTKARTANPGTTTSTSTAATKTTQPGRLAASRKPLSLQPPKPVASAIAKPPPPSATASLITRPTATTKPLLRQPNLTASTSSTSTTTKTAVPRPKGAHLPGPGPALHTSTSSQTSRQQHPPPQHDHDFDTYQQHYIPAKVPLAPKPLTSSFLAPPTPSKKPANVAASAETSRLQTELLQLNLLHQDAERTKQEWEGDAKKKLRERWEALRKDGQEVGEMEKVLTEDAIVEELLCMLSSGFGSSGASSVPGLAGTMKLEEEKIQALDEVTSGVWAMSEPCSSSGAITMGKYTRVVRKFEVWAERAGRILEERRATETEGEGRLKLDENGQAEMVGGMDVEWKNECVALGRRLEEWRMMLRELRGGGGGGPLISSVIGAGAGGSFRASRSIHGVKDLQQLVTDLEEEHEGELSALERGLNGFGSLVNNMLAELEIMEQIEREAVAEENEWVRKMNRVDDEKKEEGGQAGAIWRAF
ncbi:hypothetical protein B0T20DRAFT_484569 [Sordaria brevicollis]|uniref:Uncharacterized protein n=1 Tax=Sordaria brevicollis TaxID=83679 RepID=A0AAE0U273_SORBR|nr:hypothetical protein B0T20DRAFT_484569 [Sordaria brevicollis]